MTAGGGRGSPARGGTGSGARVELRIDAIAVGGDGVGREASGRVVFVPRTAPGDVVVAEVRRSAAAWARALPVRLLERGAARRDAPCPLYGSCGGCQLQHLDPEAQREAKRAAVADALARIGEVRVEVPPVRAVGPELGYRNRLTFTLRRPGAGVAAGFHRVEGGDALAEVDDCPLGEPAVQRAWRALRAAWGEDARRLPGGRELRITVRASAAGAVSVLVRGGSARSPGEPAELAAVIPGLAGYAWRPAGAPRRTLVGEERLLETWRGILLSLRPETFVQVNRAAAETIEAWVDGAAGALAGRRAVDLYAGAGSRAIRWAAAGARVTAVEVDAEAVQAGREAAAAAGVAPRLVAARVEERVEGLLPADVVVVNPPRRGLGAGVCRALATRARGRLVYVSCDPATLARDLRRLAPGWRVVAVRAFDAFPNTSHVETVALLEAVGGGQ